MTGSSRTWIVLLEAVPTGNAPTVDGLNTASILRAMGDETAVGLHSPDRIAVQVSAPADDPGVALTTLLCRWRSAVHQTGLEGWDVVRAEVMTPEEFDLEFSVG